MPIIINPSGAPATPDALHEFLRTHLELNVSRTPISPGSSAPFAYLCHAFFEGRTFAGPSESPATAARDDPDSIVWASRGGGKTFLGAVATLLDLLFKPGIQVHLLAGSVEQGRRMHHHLRALLERPNLADFVDGRLTARSVKLVNGSRAELLAQSETSVRGCRVQKLRCDEVELFDRDVWSAAQLVTRTIDISGPWGSQVRGAIDALSTMHRPFGLMWELVEHFGDSGEPSTPPPAAPRPVAEPESGSAARGRRLFKWGVLDVLEHCPSWRHCEGCSLRDECRGEAKQRPPAEAGHVGVGDARLLKSRVSLPVWQTEMLCMRPSRTDSVFPEFSWERHVINAERAAETPPAGATWLMGMDFGFRSPTVMLLATYDDQDVLRVLEERIESACTVQEHLDAVRLLGWPRPAWIGIDPAGMQVNDQTGRSAKDVLEAAGYITRQRRSEIHNGLMRVRARLAPADHSPARLLISRRCPKLIEAMTRYHYDIEREQRLEPVKDGPDHAADALRYLVTNLDRPGAKRAAYLPQGR